MDYIEFLLPGLVITIGAIVHIEVSIATLKNDMKWVKKYLNKEEEK